MKKSKLIFLSAVTISCALLSGCFEKPVTVDNSGENVSVSSGEQEVVFQNQYETFGNGTDIVSYKGKTYYIEYGNNDFTDEAIRSPWYYVTQQSNSQRYINIIDEKGNIRNLFKVTGANSFYILDDRFYIQSASGLLYTVDMKGQNSIELTRGEYVAYDIDDHAIYYTNNNNPNILYRMNTIDLQIESLAFDNPLTTGTNRYLGTKAGNLYYISLDDKKSEVILLEHNIKDNKTQEVDRIKMELSLSEYEGSTMEIVWTRTLGNYCGFVIGLPNEGTIRGYYDRAFYVVNLENKTITYSPVDKPAEGDWYSEYSLEKQLFAHLYKASNNKSLPLMDTIVTNEELNKFANKYHIDLNEKLGEEAKESVSCSPDENKYIVEVEDYRVVGTNVFYKITASRLNPAGEIGWRTAFIRMCSEVYIYNLDTKENKFVYSYINNNFAKVEEKIEELVASGEIYSGEISELIDANTSAIVEPLKEGEMYIDIDTSKQWKDEFDIRVEEVGGMIIGKRIEYEGHHTKSEGTLKIKVNKEPGAMLTVYVDGELDSQMRID